MGYQPISAYGIVGNDDRCALISTDGSVDWCCFPHAAAPSVFGRLLDAEDGGHFAVEPTASYDSEQAYADRTNVLETTFSTSTGRATLTDFMPVGDVSGLPVSETTDEGDLKDGATNGDDYGPRYQRALYRQFRCDDGRLTVSVDFRPRLDYARAETTVELTDDQRTDHVVARGNDESLHLQHYGPLDLRIKNGRAVGTATIEAGEAVWFVLQHGHFTSVPSAACAKMRQATIDYWREWSDGLEEMVERIVDDDPWFEEVLRSGLVLKLLINEGTGAIYAAATTSLPEAYGGSNNWDYRYNWIRDAKFTVQALYNLGQTDVASRYFEWFREISDEDPEKIQPVYGVHGEHDLTERYLEHLRGYRFSTPVRIGNAAAEQRQLDVYGAIVQGLYETVLQDGELTPGDWASVEAVVDHVCAVWDEKGAGIWEFRAEPYHYVHSKLLCWVALDRGIELAEHADVDADVDRWRDERSAVREAIEQRGFSESAGSFVQHFDTDETLDAACLLLPIYEFLPPDDSRIEQTLDTVMDELLTDEGLVHRTKGSEVPPEGRGTFLFCSFWLVDALVLAGREDEAREIFTNVLEHVDEPHLLPERIDPATGEYLGNYPQAFSHIGLINSAIYLCSAADDRSLEHDPQAMSVDTDPLFRS